MRLRFPPALFLAFAAMLALLALAEAGPAARGAGQQGPLRPSLFACYPGQFNGYKPTIPLLMVDQLSRRPGVVVFGTPETICTPASGSGGSLAGWSTYLTCYRTAPTGFASSTRTKDALGSSASLRILRRASICLPSARVDAGGASEPSKALDRYLCYHALPDVAGRGRVPIADVFGSSADSVTGPQQFCAPMARPGARLAAPTSYLTCYAVASETRATTIVVKNELGFLKAALGPRGRLCAAATRT
jgi:hypothetical protein